MSQWSAVRVSFLKRKAHLQTLAESHVHVEPSTQIPPMYKFLVGVGQSKDTKGLTERSTKYSPIRERMSFGFGHETLGGRDTPTRVFNLGAPREA